MKTAFKIIKKIVNILLVLFVLIFLLMVCLQRFTNNQISFFNYRMFTVASGSMAPEYEVGDVLIAKETPPEDVKVGDSITYLGNKGSFKGKVVTHSVTRIEKDESGNYIFHTKGIANLVEDPPVYANQVYGVIVWNPKIMSFIYKLLNTKYGIFIFVILPIFYIVGSELLSAMLEKEEARRQKLKEAKQKNKEKETKEVKEENSKETKKEDKEENNDEVEVEIEDDKKESVEEETETEEKEIEKETKDEIKEEVKEEKQKVEKKEKIEEKQEEKETTKEDKKENNTKEVNKQQNHSNNNNNNTSKKKKHKKKK